MFIATILAVALTFLLSFMSLDHFLVRCGANERTSFVASTVFAILSALLITVATSSKLFGAL